MPEKFDPAGAWFLFPSRLIKLMEQSWLGRKHWIKNQMTTVGAKVRTATGSDALLLPGIMVTSSP